MILLTGATGYLGTLALARILERTDLQVICPVRARSAVHADERLDATLRTLWRDPPATARDRVAAVPFDLDEPAPTLAGLREVTHVLHCAANVGFEQPLDEARRTNVGGAVAVAGLAARAPRLERLVHVSTAYVAGTCHGVFGEHDLDVGQDFRNTYEESKFEAEARMRHAAADLPYVIARPSVVVGESGTGWTTTFNVLYPLLRAYSRGLLGTVPADPDCTIDVVTGDYVADALVALLLDAPGAHGAYHLVAGDRALTLGRLRDLASEAFGRPPIELADPGGRPDAALGPFGPYLSVRAQFDDTRAAAALGACGVARTDAAAELGVIVAFALRTRWGKQPVPREVGAPAPATIPAA